MKGDARWSLKRLSYLFPALACLIIHVTTTAAALPDDDRFDEHLTLRPLADGRLHTFFTFTLQSRDTPIDAASASIFSVVPRSLIHLATSSDAEQIHMAINAGRWDYQRWGDPGQEQMVGTGAHVKATLGHRGADYGLDGATVNMSRIPPPIMANWRKLTANLAGQFCASLDALDEHLTVQPFHLRQDSTSTILHASLASESICTENLSTLLKLLPCKAMTGLASLLKPHYFFAADFHGMSLHMEQVREGWKVVINVQAVFSPAMKPIRARRDWSLQSIFGTPLQQSCPLVGDSSITVLAPTSSKTRGGASSSVGNADFTVWPIVVSKEEAEQDQEDEEEKTLDEKAVRFATKLQRRGSYTFDTRSSNNLDVQMKWDKVSVFNFPDKYSTPSLVASRTFTGYGQERGKMELVLRNTRLLGERRVVYSDIFPHFIKPYLHTLSVQVEADDFDEEQDNIVRFRDDLTSPLLLSFNYSSNPFHIQVQLRIPPQSSIRLSLEYDKTFLRYTQHPPDAHRGFDIAPATITLEDGKSTLFTDPALIEVAVPDFSMPYNVIIFTSTLIALCAGSTLNNLLRRYTDIVS